MSVFDLDPIEEADRAARIANEKNHLKKRKINGYNQKEEALEDAIIRDSKYNFYRKEK